MITERRQGVYRKRSCASFGEWLHTHRLSSPKHWAEIREATGLSKSTITNREQQLRMPPEELTARVSITFIHDVCDLFGLDQADREEGLYLGGWSERVEPTDSQILPAEAVKAIAQISRTALDAILDICATCGVDLDHDQQRTGRTLTPAREFSSEDDPVERLRMIHP